MSADLEALYEISRFLYEEAELLDQDKTREWLDRIVGEEISYEAPLRVTRERESGREFSQDAFHFRENRSSLETRVSRLETEYAWAENPPSRTRRLVANITCEAAGLQTWRVASNLLIFRSRYDSTEYVLIAGRRLDTIRRSPKGLRLVARKVLLDHTTLPVHNLGIFL